MNIILSETLKTGFVATRPFFGVDPVNVDDCVRLSSVRYLLKVGGGGSVFSENNTAWILFLISIGKAEYLQNLVSHLIFWHSMHRFR